MVPFPQKLTAMLIPSIAVHLLTAVINRNFASNQKANTIVFCYQHTHRWARANVGRLALRLRTSMQEYCLSRDDLDFVLSVTKFKGKEAWKEDPMASVETQTKAAFTRTFNKAEHKARCNLAVDDFKKKKGKGEECC